jgi:DNA-binding protein HU-beta
MATMTKTQLVKLMAEKIELTNKQAATFLDTLADVAVKECMVRRLVASEK